MAPGARVVLASPGVSSVPGELAAVVSALAAGDTDGGIPAADIIIDDLFYPNQNPFEIDEVSEEATRRIGRDQPTWIRSLCGLAPSP